LFDTPSVAWGVDVFSTSLRHFVATLDRDKYQKTALMFDQQQDVTPFQEKMYDITL
jgi:hypothetical protein